MFADDTILYVDGLSVSEVESKMQECVTDASNWFTSNKLLLNTSKSNVMMINPCKRNKEKLKCKIHINANEIENIDNALYLGLSIDDNISWSEQIDKMCKLLGMKIASLKRARKWGNKEILKQIYQYTIQPVIDYGITIWSDTTSSNLQKIQRLQNHCARVILNNFDFKTYRGIDLVKSLKWMNVKERIDYFLCLTMFKCLNDKAPHYMQNEVTFVSDINTHVRTKRRYDIHLPPFTTNKKERSVYIRGAKVWNILPYEIKSLKNLETLKGNTKCFMTSKYMCVIL